MLKLLLMAGRRALIAGLAAMAAACGQTVPDTPQPGPMLPVGIFVPNQRAVTEAGVPIACVAVELAPDTIDSGRATVHWWTNLTGCSSRASGITTQAAELDPVTLPAVPGLPERVGYRVSFEVGRIPSGTDEVSFSLDPTAARANGLALLGVLNGETVPTLLFSRVDQLRIPGPGDDEPVATPAPPR